MPDETPIDPATCDHLSPDGTESLVWPDENNPKKVECTACHTRFRPVRGEGWVHTSEVDALVADTVRDASSGASSQRES